MDYKTAKRESQKNPNVLYTWTDQHGHHRGYFCPIRDIFIAEFSHDGKVWFR